MQKLVRIMTPGKLYRIHKALADCDNEVRMMITEKNLIDSVAKVLNGLHSGLHKGTIILIPGTYEISSLYLSVSFWWHCVHYDHFTWVSQKVRATLHISSRKQHFIHLIMRCSGGTYRDVA